MKSMSRENEELQIIGQVEDDPEWWVARNRDGKIGLVPRIYTERLQPTFPEARTQGLSFRNFYS